jgi:hypothetical protein
MGLLAPAFWLISLSIPTPLKAISTLVVCNRGTIAVDVFVATHHDIPRNYWILQSWRIDPGACHGVYNENDDELADIGFAFTDRQGRWSGVKNEHPPDLGFVSYNPVEAALMKTSGHDALTRSQRNFCVRPEASRFGINDEPGTNCSALRLDGFGHFQTLPASFSFLPEGRECSGTGAWTSCSGGDYYLNIAADPNTRQLTAARGSEKGVDSPLQDRAEATAQTAQLLADLQDRQDKQEQAARARQYELDRQREAARRRSVAQFSPQWIGQGLIIDGTISRVQRGRGSLVQLFFQESPDGAFAACFPGKDDFVGFANSGPTYQGLVGKTVELRGRVTQQNSCGGKTAGLEMSVSIQISVLSTPGASPASSGGRAKRSATGTPRLAASEVPANAPPVDVANPPAAPAPSPSLQTSTERATSAQPIPPPIATPEQVRDLNQRYSALLLRASQARAGLTRTENQTTRDQIRAGRLPEPRGSSTPPNVRDARTRMDSELHAAGNFISQRDAVHADESLKAAEDALGVVEKFLGR